MNDEHETETIDKLFLELSQFTNAITERERKLTNLMLAVRDDYRDMRNGTHEGSDAHKKLTERINYITSELIKL